MIKRNKKKPALTKFLRGRQTDLFSFSDDNTNANDNDENSNNATATLNYYNQHTTKK
jgi:hypothetical protein